MAVVMLVANMQDTEGKACVLSRCMSHMPWGLAAVTVVAAGGRAMSAVPSLGHEPRHWSCVQALKA